MRNQKQVVLIVIYKMKLSDSPVFQSIVQQNSRDIQLIVYDNSPMEMCDVPTADFLYFHDSENKGLFAAYNYAVTFCRVNQIQWLTIFDQDTRIPDAFFESLRPELQDNPCCIVPNVELANHQLISPFIVENALFLFKFRTKKDTLAAINSGTTINVNFFQKHQDIFHDDFPLDFLDYDFFARVAKLNGRIDVIPTTLVQDLSVSDYPQVSTQRFASFLQYESKFVNAYYSSRLGEYRLKLILRAFKLLVQGFQLSKVNVILDILKGKSR
ncbi:glycosyltransferase [Lactiplantibacillus pentosus]|uniref:glycosyltransferase n=1 Tax=Lactiplantibacillus pentosus TaxID=1589 RepID=UPI003C2C49FB